MATPKAHGMVECKDGDKLAKAAASSIDYDRLYADAGKTSYKMPTVRVIDGLEPTEPYEGMNIPANFPKIELHLTWPCGKEEVVMVDESHETVGAAAGRATTLAVLARQVALGDAPATLC